MVYKPALLASPSITSGENNFIAAIVLADQNITDGDA